MKPGPEQASAPGIIDLLVYAPLGAAISVAEDLPRLARLGRERASAQLATALVVGTVALSECRRRVGQLGQLGRPRA